MVRFTDAQPWLVIEMLTIIPINNEKIVKCISNLHLIIHEEVLRCSIQNQNWDVVVLFHNKHNCIFIRNREERLGCCVGQTPAQDKTMYYVSESTIKIYFTLNEKTIQNVHSPSHIWNSYWFHDSFGDLINNFYWTCISQFIFHLTPTVPAPIYNFMMKKMQMLIFLIFMIHQAEYPQDFLKSKTNTKSCCMQYE